MKKFKLLIASVLVFVMAFALTACSAPVVGTWELTEVKAEGVSIDIEEVGMSMTLEIKDDGSIIMTQEMDGDSESYTSYWKFEDDTLYIYEEEGDEESSGEIKYEDGKLILDMMGAEMIFEKK